jgi:hypothetical protein
LEVWPPQVWCGGLDVFQDREKSFATFHLLELQAVEEAGECLRHGAGTNGVATAGRCQTEPNLTRESKYLTRAVRAGSRVKNGHSGGPLAACKTGIGKSLFRVAYCREDCSKISVTFWRADLAHSWVLGARLGRLSAVLKCFDFAKKMELCRSKVDESASTKYCVDKALGVDILGSRPSGLG